MKTFEVEICFIGSITVKVDAKNKLEAREKSKRIGFRSPLMNYDSPGVESEWQIKNTYVTGLKDVT